MKNPIIAALDVPDTEGALKLAEAIAPAVGAFKIGKELFVSTGPDIVKRVRDTGASVFLDLKFHDIPNTVAGAVEATADLGVWMVNVHASGGRRMMEASAERLAQRGLKTHLIAVTVLTSMSDDELQEIGVSGDALAQVERLARLTRESGLDGVVCSARESARLTELCGEAFLKVTPGIRPATADQGDQRRVMTPEAAMAAGSTHLVIGRAITQAADPMSALTEIERSLSWQ